MMEFLAVAINGAFIGLLYGLIAICFVFIYRSSMVFNMAQGEMVALAAFFYWTFASYLEFSTVLAVVLTVITCSAVGLVIERLFLRKLVGENIFSLVMATIGLLLVLRGVILVAWGPDLKFFPVTFGLEPIKLGAIVIDRALFYGGILTVIMAFAADYFFNKTLMGLEMTAVAEDHETTLSMGISVAKSSALAWVISAVLSIFVAIIYLNGKGLSFAAADVAFIALPAVLLGGLESLLGALLAGVGIGIAAQLAGFYIDPLVGGGVADVFPFLIMIVVLVVRPTGLFGWKTIERI